MTTFAVFRPTPGSSTGASSALGPSPPWRSTSAFDIPSSERVLARKNPVERMSFSRLGGRARASSRAVGYLRKSSGVTMFTRSSVHCAERIVATSSSNGVRNSSAMVASGYARASRSRIFLARACFAARASAIVSVPHPDRLLADADPRDLHRKGQARCDLWRGIVALAQLADGRRASSHLHAPDPAARDLRVVRQPDLEPVEVARDLADPSPHRRLQRAR